jgi:hypothetical protein
MIAVRPPEYFPRLEYVALMMVAEVFVLADTYQYSRQSFQNRARLRNPQGWQWISVPLRGGQHGRPIRAVEIRQGEPWAGKHARAFHYNYRSAPFFDYYEPQLAPVFARRWTHLGALTCETVELVARLLNRAAPLVRASRLSGAPATLPAVLEAVGPGPLVVLPETAALDAPHAQALRVLACAPPRYRQAFAGFEPGMTALDLLFNYGPEASAVLREATSLRSP